MDKRELKKDHENAKGVLEEHLQMLMNRCSICNGKNIGRMTKN